MSDAAQHEYWIGRVFTLRLQLRDLTALNPIGQRAVIEAERLTARCFTLTAYHSGSVATRQKAIFPATIYRLAMRKSCIDVHWKDSRPAWWSLFRRVRCLPEKRPERSVVTLSVNREVADGI